MSSDGPYLKRPENKCMHVGDVSVVALHPSGMLSLSAIRGGARACKKFDGYTIDEAVNRFNSEFPPDE